MMMSSILGWSNCSLVACLELRFCHVVPASLHIIVSFCLAFSSDEQCGFHVCLLSKDIGIMIASLHIMWQCTEWQDVVIIFQEFSYCPCMPTFRLWLHLVLETFVVVLADCCLDLALCQALFHVIRRHFLSLPLSFFMSCFCFGVSYWLGGYLHLHSFKTPYHHSLSMLLQLSNCLLFPIVWQVYNAFDNPSQDSEWMFWFSIFSLKLLVYAWEL